MKVTGWRIENKPAHQHDCDRCTHLFTIDAGPEQKIDVYMPCNVSGRGTATNPVYLLRYSSEGPDYVMPGLSSLVVGHAMSHDHRWMED